MGSRNPKLEIQSSVRLQSKLESNARPSEVMEKKTEFFALHKRPSPTAHLSNLRGHQDNEELLHDNYLSPALHNVPDTYIRYLQSQVRHSRKFCEGIITHNPYNENAKKKLSLLRTGLQLQEKASGFMGSIGLRKREEKSFKSLQLKQDYFVKREAAEMEELGWKPSDWAEMQSPAGKGKALKTLFLKSRIVRRPTPFENLRAFPDSKKGVSTHQQPHGETSAMPKTETKITTPNDPQERKAKFLSDLLSVRSQTMTRIEQNRRSKIKGKHGKKIEEAQKLFKRFLVSLRLQMLRDHVFALNDSNNVDFACKERIGRHEVVFKGLLREMTLKKGLRNMGGYVDRAVKLANISDFWKHVEKDDFFDVLRDKGRQKEIRAGVERLSWKWLELRALSKAAMEKRDAAGEMAGVILESVLSAVDVELREQKAEMEKKPREPSPKGSDEPATKRRKSN